MKKTNIIILEPKPLEPKLYALDNSRMSSFSEVEPVALEADWLEEAHLSFYGITKLSFRVSSHKAH